MLNAELLRQAHSFPGDYVFKFIVPEVGLDTFKIMVLAHDAKVCFQFRESSKGKYIGVTFTLQMASAEDVLKVYQSIGTLKGILAL